MSSRHKATYADKQRRSATNTVVRGLALCLLGSVAFGGHEALAAEAAPKTGATSGKTDAETAQAADSGTAATVQDVVVTARRKKEKSQDVPIAITTISPKQLQATGATTMQQAFAQAPSITIQGVSPRNTTLTIRGLGSNTGTSTVALEQGVGIYVDGVYYAKPAIAVFDMPDLERIEVLRGPQGTLFGKNTTAGVVNVTSREPSFTTGASGEVSVGNYGFVQARGTATGQVGDSDVAVRLSALTTDRNGTIYNSAQHGNWNDNHSRSIRGQILYVPTDNFRLKIIADATHQQGQQGFSVVKDYLPGTLSNGSKILSFADKAARFPGYVPVPADPSLRITDDDRSQNISQNVGGISAQADWTLNNGFTLTSISAYRFWNYMPSWDGDQFGLPLVNEGTNAEAQKQFSQEVRLTSPGGTKLDYTAGLYYFWWADSNNSETAYGTGASTWFLGSSVPSAVLNNLSARSHQYPRTNSYSGFAQATYHATPKWDITAGLRYTYEQKTGDYYSYATGEVAPISSLPTALQATATSLRNAYAPVTGYSQTYSNGDPSGTFTVSYKPTPNIMTYATYGRGFKSGGINLTSPVAGVTREVDPEYVNAYEVGVKNTLFNNRLILNADLFWEDDTGYQATAYTQVNGSYYGYISNVGKVRSRGVELEARAAPIKGLTTTFSGAYTDAKYLSYTNSQCPYLQQNQKICDLSGSRLAGVSPWSFYAAAEYARPLGAVNSAPVVGYLGADNTFRSAFYSTLNDDPYGEIPTYDLVGVHAGIRAEDGQWDLSLWGRNILDKTYYTTATVSTSTNIAAVSLGEPRTFGLTLRVKL